MKLSPQFELLRANNYSTLLDAPNLLGYLFSIGMEGADMIPTAALANSVRFAFVPVIAMEITKLPKLTGRTKILHDNPSLFLPQKPNQCYLDSAEVVLEVTNKTKNNKHRLKPYSFFANLFDMTPSAEKLIELVKISPVLACGYQIAQSESKYRKSKSHHYIALIDIVEIDGSKKIIALDRDDTIKRTRNTIHLWDPEDLASKICPKIEPENSAAAVEVPYKPLI